MVNDFLFLYYLKEPVTFYIFYVFQPTAIIVIFYAYIAQYENLFKLVLIDSLLLVDRNILKKNCDKTSSLL